MKRETIDNRLTAEREKLDQSWASFREAIAGLTPEQAEEIGACGEWSVKQVIGNVALWDGISADDLKRRIENGGDPGKHDWKRLNDEVASRDADRSLDEVLADLEHNHRVLLAQLDNLDSDDALAAEMAVVLHELTFDHYDEHRDQIRAWRTKDGQSSARGSSD